MTVELRQLLEAATPGPWQLDGGVSSGIHIGPDHIVCFGHDYDDYGGVSEDDAALIAALRNAAPFLLDVVDAARHILAKSQEYATEAKAKGVWSEKDADCIVIAGNIAWLEPKLAALDAHLAGKPLPDDPVNADRNGASPFGRSSDEDWG